MQTFFQKAKESTFEDVKAQIEEASGKKLEDMFLGSSKHCEIYNLFLLEFDPKPISAASIAQVHIAKLKNGDKVAVKVLFGPFSCIYCQRCNIDG